MFKKVVGSLILASALSVGFGSIDSEANQWNLSSINQEQTNSGWDRLIERQNERINVHQREFSGSMGAAQVQSVFVNEFQFQSGKSNGSAEATQTSEITIDVGDQQTNGTTELEQTTQGSLTNVQNTSTSRPSYLLQSQSNSTAVFHFQGSIKGGPSIQNQISQVHSYQYTTVISK
jgi:hypothetical protein